MLLQLGGSVFLAFVPFIVLVSVLFGGVYSVSCAAAGLAGLAGRSNAALPCHEKAGRSMRSACSYSLMIPAAATCCARAAVCCTVPAPALLTAALPPCLQLFGESFVHGGRADSGPPAYVDPDVLLSEQTVDRYIPFQ